MGVLDPSPFIEDPAPSAGWMGMGPQMGAQGNIGGLQRALHGRVGGGPVQAPQQGQGALTRPASEPIVSPEMGQDLEAMLRARIRSPEQLENAQAARRGALERLNAANSEAPNDYTWDTHFMEGIMNTHPSLSAGDAFTFGVANAMKAGRESQERRALAKIANAQNELKFEQGEELAADRGEKSAMTDVARIMIAQNKLAAATEKANKPQQRWKWTKDGLFDFHQLDERGIPKLVRPASVDMMRYYDAAVRRATQKAMSDGMEFPSAQAREAWIQKTASSEIAMLTDAEGDTIVPAVTPSQPSQPATTPTVNKDQVNILMQELQESVKSGDPARIEQSQKDLLAAMSNTTKIDTSEQLAQRVSAAQGKQPAPGIAPAPAAAPAPVGGPILKTPTQLAQEKKFVEANEGSAVKVLDSWRSQANQANDALATVGNIQALRDQFEPGKFSGIKEQVGAYLDALGLTKGGLPKEARTIQQINRMIKEQVNARMTEENGVQTEGDTQRFMQAYASVQDTPAAFDFTLGMLKERALRQQERMRIADAYGKAQKSNVGAQEAWIEHRDQALGPMLQKTPNGMFWRHDYIERAVEATLKANPGADPDIVRGMAEDRWIQLSKGGKK